MYRASFIMSYYDQQMHNSVEICKSVIFCEIIVHLLVKVHNKNIKIKTRVLIFPTNYVRNFSHSKKNPARYYHKYSGVLMWKYPLFLPDFNGTWIFKTDFRKSLNMHFYKNPSVVSRVVPCGQTDWQKEGHDEDNSCFSQLCEGA
jgi:hypothetical protein